MNNILRASLLLSLLIFASHAKAEERYLKPTTGNPALDTLYARNKIENVLFDKDGCPQQLLGRMSPREKSEDSLETFYRFIEEYPDVFRVDNLRENLRVAESKRLKTTERSFGLKQYYKGVPVLGSAGGVSVRSDGTMTLITLVYFRGIQLDVVPKLDEAKAKARAAKILDSEVSECGFRKMDFGIFSYEGKYYLAWHVLAGCKGGAGDFYMDANTGKVIVRFDVNVY